jgi:Zn finger protein HypA/HybF involved in hydrogenase expression
MSITECPHCSETLDPNEDSFYCEHCGENVHRLPDGGVNS